MEELRAIGAQVEEVTVAERTGSVTPRQELSDIAARIHSDTWQIPDSILAESVAELTAWAVTQYDDLDAPIAVARRVGFDVVRFEHCSLAIAVSSLGVEALAGFGRPI
jgi:hypothetical protein